MFFGNQEDETEPSTEDLPYRIFILTDQFLIEGLDEGGFALSAAFDADPNDPSGGCLTLLDARLQSLGVLDVPPRSFERWLLPSFDKVIAIWSNEPPAEDALLDAWEDFQTPIKTLIYAGDISIECKLYYDEDGSTPDFSLHSFAPFEEGLILNLRDKKSPALQAKWGVVNSALMHGFSVEK